jgi:mRNA interferase MazF
MNRGDLGVAVLPGDYGKPRPILIVQSDLFSHTPSVTVLPLTSDLRESPIFRVMIEPSPGNGLKERSQVMVDKAHTLRRNKVSYVFGRLDAHDHITVNRALAVFLGFS